MCGNGISKMDDTEGPLSFHREKGEFDYNLRDDIIKTTLINYGEDHYKLLTERNNMTFRIYDSGFRFFNLLRFSNPALKKTQGEIYYPQWSEFIITPIIKENSEEKKNSKSKFSKKK